jgi:hypothetical protein
MAFSRVLLHVDHCHAFIVSGRLLELGCDMATAEKQRDTRGANLALAFVVAEPHKILAMAVWRDRSRIPTRGSWAGPALMVVMQVELTLEALSGVLEALLIQTKLPARFKHGSYRARRPKPQRRRKRVSSLCASPLARMMNLRRVATPSWWHLVSDSVQDGHVS